MDLEAIIAMTLSAGALLLALGLWALFRLRRRLLRFGLALTAVLLLVCAVLLGACAANLYTYQRLTHEEEVARLQFRQLAAQHYLALVRLADGRTLDLALRGDEWQLDVRMLKWRGPAVLLGMDTVFRLERLSGRFRDVEQARVAQHSVHALSSEAGLDLWALARSTEGWLPWVDAAYGSAAYLPMADQASYIVSVSTSGLVARPSNAAAEGAVRAWN